MGTLSRIDRRRHHIASLWRQGVAEAAQSTHRISALVAYMETLQEMQEELSTCLKAILEPPDGWKPGEDVALMLEVTDLEEEP